MDAHWSNFRNTARELLLGKYAKGMNGIDANSSGTSPPGSNSSGSRDPAYLAKLRQDSALRWTHHVQGQTFTGCPSWIQEYAALHQKALKRLPSFSSLGTSSPSLPLPPLGSEQGSDFDRILLHDCSHEGFSKGCQGIGDHMKGIQESMKMAVHSNRTPDPLGEGCASGGCTRTCRPY